MRDVTRLLTNKLMHAPSAQLRAAGETRQDLARAARELFGLPVEPDRKDSGIRDARLPRPRPAGDGTLISMKDTLLHKLERLADRQKEIHALLADPAVIQDQRRFRELSKEDAEVSPVVECFGRFQHNLQGLDSARHMLNDSDPGVRDLAQAEAAPVRATAAKAGTGNQRPAAAAGSARRSQHLSQIRAGTGGDEAAMFAGDLLRMYTRYAEGRGWQVEILSESYGEHGGFKEIIFA